jgi:regulatory protein
VLDAAAAFLAVRPRSVAETSRRLRHLGYPPALVGAVVEQLSALGYLDDAAFARAWVESRDRARPRGEAALRRELALRGVPREEINQVLAERQQATASDEASADLAAALRLLERRRAALERERDPLKRRHRAYALLARNGFDPGICLAASAAFGSAPGQDGD